MKSKFIISTVLLVGASFMASGCATISEDKCLTGNWADMGYKDGRDGVSRSKLAKYSETCAKYGALPNRAAYLANFERGVIRYCTYDKGFSRGESGSSYNEVCSGALAVDFEAGYEDGRAVYVIYQEHEGLISSYEDSLDDLVEVRRKLREDELEPGDRRRLEKKELRLEDRRESYRRDIRQFEREHGLDRYDFG